MATKQFNTVQYCMDNKIPCFTFPMDATKRTSVRWGDVTPDTFTAYVNEAYNGIAIVTGYSHFVLDFDEKKHHPPAEIKQILMDHSTAVEETPGGFHFWFKADDKTCEIPSSVNITWNGQQVTGLDIRSNKGICYVAPSHYKTATETCSYRWIKGDLSTATVAPPAIMQCLEQAPISSNSPITTSFHLDNARVEPTTEDGQRRVKILMNTRQCLVNVDHVHHEPNHSCYFINKPKKQITVIANCYSHGSRKVQGALREALIAQFWQEDEEKEVQVVASAPGPAADDYVAVKKEFEQSNFKVLDPFGFYTCIDGIWMYRDRLTMIHRYENLLLPDGTQFMTRWLKDPTMLTYKAISRDETNDPQVFVLPDVPKPEFRHETYKCKMNEEAIAVFLELAEIVTNHKPEIKEYLLNWCAHLLQKPLERPDMAIVFVGQKGVGKDTFGEFIGDWLVGRRYYQNYPNQAQFFDKHDTLKVNKFFVKVEEMSRKVLMDENNDCLLKGAVTGSTYTVNPKNSQGFSIVNYIRLMGTANTMVLNIELGERRYVLCSVSSERKGDHAFWTRVRSTLFAPEGARAIADWLLARNIDAFDPRVAPKNEYMAEMQEETKDSVLKFMGSAVNGEYNATNLYRMYSTFCTNEGLHAYTTTKFGTQLLFYMENGALSCEVKKKRTSQNVVYVISGGVDPTCTINTEASPQSE